VLLHRHRLADPKLAARRHASSRAFAARLPPGGHNTTARRLTRSSTTAASILPGGTHPAARRHLVQRPLPLS